MNILPFEKNELVVSGSFDQISKELASKTTQRSKLSRFVNPSSYEEVFRGYVEKDSFRVQLKTSYNLRPTLTGRFEAISGDKTKIIFTVSFYPAAYFSFAFFIFTLVIIYLVDFKLSYLLIAPAVGYVAYWKEMQHTKEAFMKEYEDLAYNQVAARRR